MKIIRLKGTDQKFIKRGFTLIEAIVAIAVISVGFIGSLSLLRYASSQASSLKDQVIAINLAAEGIEIVRNIRDSNWLKGNIDWRSGIPDTELGLVDYNSEYVETGGGVSGRDCLDWSGEFYTHPSSPVTCNTFFKRHVVITTQYDNFNGQVNPPAPFLEVKGVVEWRDRGINESITVVDNLYDWK